MYMTKTLVSHHRTLLKCYKGLPGASSGSGGSQSIKTRRKHRQSAELQVVKKRYNSAYPRYLLSGSSLYEASASIITDMYLIPTPRTSAQRLTVSLLVGVELANTLRQLFAQTDFICVYGVNIRDLVYGRGVVV